ncbi:MAG: SNF2-related protein [Longimicrobiales bacterium]
MLAPQEAGPADPEPHAAEIQNPAPRLGSQQAVADILAHEGSVQFQLSEDELDSFLEQVREPDDTPWYRLRQQAERLALNPGFEELIAIDANTIEELPHQTETAIRVLRQMGGRALLADEVGLGKTIEAGLILKELLVRRLVRQVLVLCPSSLVDQWQAEKSHLHRCYHDDSPHCETHSIALAGGEFSCPAHAAPCAIEGHSTRLSGLEACAACGKRVCSVHRTECEGCRRTICAKDIDGSPATCRTCAALRQQPAPDDALLDGLRSLLPDLRLNAGTWKVGRDAGHRVARVDLGWGRSLVFCVDHHTELVSHAVQHGWIRSKRLR